MREFVYGTKSQFDALDYELSAGKNYKYPKRELPAGCTPSVACLWFGKVDGIYNLCIDKGITTTSRDTRFRCLLENGELTFSSMNEMADFFRSLQVMFPKPDDGSASIGYMVHTVNSNSFDHDEFNADVVDKQKLWSIKEADRKTRFVWPNELAEPLKRKVFGQNRVIDALADKVVINQTRKNKKLLMIAFLGPTATGKSETAKSLAEVMSDVYGKEYGYIEIAGNEFIGEHTVHRFFGAPPGFVGHGQPTILDPVRKNPYHVIVINEIEKADEKILAGLMEAIDTGMLGMADNSKPIDLNHSILLFTSNIPIDMETYEECNEFERSELCRDAFTKHCGRPEISGKIGNFLVFKPLEEDAIADIIIKFVREELDSYDLKLDHIDEYLMADFLKHETKYGARGIRGLVNDSVGRHLLRTRKIDNIKGKTVRMSGTLNNIEFEIA